LWGGSAFKFGIFSRNDKSLRENMVSENILKIMVAFSKNMVVLKMRLSTKIRTNIIEVIVAIQNNDLERVNQ